jgi:diguanylate cyclase (GGDEF)-like protein
LEEIALASGPGQELVLHGADLALFSGHPAGLSQRRAAGRLGTALWEVFPGHVALLDRDGVVVSVNRAWREFGLARGGNTTAGLGVNYLELCARAAADGVAEAATAVEVVRTALSGATPSRRVDYPCHGPDETRFFRLQAHPLPGRHSGALLVHTDITSDRIREEQWQHQALHDPLTQLPNRSLLLDRLEHAVAAAADDPQSLAVLFVDLDRFKQVNDTLGHSVGDQVLAAAASRMAVRVREADTIGRWGGDEFVVVAERLQNPHVAAELAARLAAGLTEPIAAADRRLSVSASFGIAYHDGTTGPLDLVAAAGHAMHEARVGSRQLVGVSD